MIKRVQIHFVAEDGRTGVINYLNSDNAEAFSHMAKDPEGRRQKLLDKAYRMAGEWHKVFPTHKFIVKEV